jgi:hypothetical protein
MNRRPWKRLAALRAARRRSAEPASPPEARLDPVPPLVPPDDDREFLPAFPPGFTLVSSDTILVSAPR